MEENAKVPFLKPAFIYGSLLGFTGILVSVLFYLLGLFTTGWFSAVIHWAIWIAVLAFCLVSYRNRYLGGKATFGNVFYMAAYAGYVASILNALYTILFHMVIDPNLMGKAMRANEELMDNPMVTENTMDYAARSSTILLSAGSVLIIGMIISVIFGLIIAAFVQKKENPVSHSGQ